MRKYLIGSAVVVLLWLSASASAQERELDPLLKLLIENKVITLTQAEAVQAEYDKRKTGVAETARQIAKEETAKAMPSLPDGLKDFKFSGVAFLSFQNGNSYDNTKSLVSGRYPETHFSQFILKRGYLTVDKKITDWLDARFTTDIKQDSSGNWFIRTKYLYGKFHWKGSNAFSKPYIEAGSVHLPWMDFEEGMNGYRAQDTMFIERAGVMGSADLGVTAGSNLGPDLPETYKKDVNGSYAGRWGSWQVGYYNGGGYDAAEKNMNKVVMARVSLRPMPGVMPGFQVTLFDAKGKGNIPDTWSTSGAYKGRENYPEFSAFLGMLSFEHKHVTAYGQYYAGRGNKGGSSEYADFTAKEQRGYSFFAKANFPANRKLTFFARYDFFDTDTRQNSSKADETIRWIGGLSWNLYKGNFLLLDYDALRHSLEILPDEDRWQLTLQLKF